MTTRLPRPSVPRLTAPLVAVGLVTGMAFAPAPAYASSSADLTVTLANKVDAKPGRRVSYQVVVRNKGPATAAGVRIDFTTSATLRSVTYRASKGRCHRSPRETVCTFGRIGAGTTATATISGIVPKKLRKGTPVINRVTVASNTRLVNPADDVATDNYRIGVPRAAPPVTPSPAPSGGDKIAAVTSAASKMLDYSRKAAVVTFAVLGASIAWFAIGLTLRRRTRARRAFTDTD